MLWFDPSLHMHAAGDSWNAVSFFDKTSHDAFLPPRSKRAWEYTAQYPYAFSSFDSHKYTRYETQSRRRHQRRVHFGPDEHRLDGPPSVTVIEIPNRYSLSLEQKRAMWYNGYDVRCFFREARKAQDRVRAQNGCRCLNIRKCSTCRPLWRAMD